jgi:hypothetical protein
VDDRTTPVPIGFWEVLAFGCETAMLLSLGVVGWLGADGVLPRILLMIAMPGLAVAIWAVWMAPRSPRRLKTPWLSIAQIALFALTGAALATVGHAWWGIAIATISIVDVAALSARGRTT